MVDVIFFDKIKHWWTTTLEKKWDNGFLKNWNVVSYITLNSFIIKRDKCDRLWSNLIRYQSKINYPPYVLKQLKCVVNVLRIFNKLLEFVVPLLCNYYAQRDTQLCGNHQASWELRGYYDYLSNSFRAEITHTKMIENTIH